MRDSVFPTMGTLYIDAAGDSGFKDNSPKRLVIAAIYFKNRDDLHRWQFAYRVWEEATQRRPHRD